MAGVLAGTSVDHLSADKCLRVRHPMGDVKKLLSHSHFARSKVFSYKEISIRLKNLSDSILCARLLREASPSLLYEVIAAWNLTAANAPQNLVCVTGGIRTAILSQPARKYWNCNPGVV